VHSPLAPESNRRRGRAAGARGLARPASALLLLAACGAAAPSWPELKAEIRRQFPEVAQLSILEYRGSHAVAAFLVDARAPEEFAVSHIRGAVNLQEAADIAGAFEKSGKEEIVL